MKELIPIQENYERDPNRCWNALVRQAGAISKCTNENCEGYSCYDDESGVWFCPDYKRIKTLEFEGQ